MSLSKVGKGSLGVKMEKGIRSIIIPGIKGLVK
jgi:hypothetical protein